jgi:hypothetical protein
LPSFANESERPWKCRTWRAPEEYFRETAHAFPDQPVGRRIKSSQTIGPMMRAVLKITSYFAEAGTDGIASRHSDNERKKARYAADEHDARNGRTQLGLPDNARNSSGKASVAANRARSSRATLPRA